MIEVHKHYILDENQRPVAVQIAIDQFEQIEKILENSGQIILTTRENEAEAAQDEAWLNADLGSLGRYESYDWQPGELEAGSPVKYIPGKGVVIEE
ncbi:hypothetical protein [Phormidesmis priestleyi]